MKEEDFEKINNSFDSKLDKVVDRISHIFDEKLEQKLHPINNSIDAIMETTQANAVAMDKQIGLNKDVEAEQAAANGQLMRHEGWIKKLAKKTDLKLEY